MKHRTQRDWTRLQTRARARVLRRGATYVAAMRKTSTTNRTEAARLYQEAVRLFHHVTHQDA
jgi:hypothetical protein